MGLLVVMITLNICVDFIFFTYRLYKLGFLNMAFMRNSLKLWSMILPLAALAGWGFSYLFNTVVPEQMYITRILLNGVSFTVFFAGITLLIDKALKDDVSTMFSSVFKTNINKQTVLNEH